MYLASDLNLDSETAEKYKKAADDAVAVQDACNLSAIVHTWSSIVLDVLWPIAHQNNHGTDWVNQHPINLLFIDKLADLAGYRVSLFTDAFDLVEQIRKEE